MRFLLFSIPVRQVWRVWISRPQIRNKADPKLGLSSDLTASVQRDETDSFHDRSLPFASVRTRLVLDLVPDFDYTLMKNTRYICIWCGTCLCSCSPGPWPLLLPDYT